MISNKAKQRAEVFASSLSGLSSEEIKDACKEEMMYLRGHLKIKTIRSYLTSYRKIAREKGFNLDAFMVIEKHENEELEADKRKRVGLRSKNQKPIVNYSDMLNKAIEVLKSSEVLQELVAAICLLTGRRMTEVLSTAKFKLIGRSLEKVVFEGQLKKRGMDKGYEIFTLYNSAKLVKSALKRVRTLTDVRGLNNDQISNKYRTRINGMVLRLFNEYIGYCTCKDLRDVYATIATRLHKEEGQSVNSFLHEILGHEENDLATANTYQKYYIKS